MRRYRRRGLLLGITLMLSHLALLANAADLEKIAAINVTIDGQVLKPGTSSLPPLARLADAAIAAGVRADAYLPGAIWYHQSAKAAQQELKIGLLHDLTDVIRNGRLDNLPERATLALRLRAQVEAMPVTGRRVNTLDPIPLELDRKANRLLDDGDVLYYPARPDVVVVMGAVTQDCALPFVSRKAATDYARSCPQTSEADTDWLYIISPDGGTRRYAIGAWNAEAPVALQPGSRLLVPLRSRPQQPVEELNQELASFFATQPLHAKSKQQ